MYISENLQRQCFFFNFCLFYEQKNCNKINSEKTAFIQKGRLKNLTKAFVLETWNMFHKNFIISQKEL